LKDVSKKKRKERSKNVRNKRRLVRKPKLSNLDKSLYIAGTMALALFTFLTLCGVFIAQALGVGVIAGVVTHIFFNEYYYKIKD